MKKMSICLCVFIIFGVNCSNENQEKIIGYTFNSEAIGKSSYFLIFTPRGEQKPHPVLYLLNGYGADPYAWSSGADLRSGAVEFEMYIVSIALGTHPYVNDPIDTTKRYEDYVLEIIDIMDSKFNTLSGKYNRGIGGMSMGGGGSLSIASRHPDMFVSVSATSPGRLNTAIPNAANLKGVEVMFDCGLQDGLLAENRSFHNYLLELNVPHSYYEYPGEHNWIYWGQHYWSHLEFHATNFLR